MSWLLTCEEERKIAILKNAQGEFPFFVCVLTTLGVKPRSNNLPHVKRTVWGEDNLENRQTLGQVADRRANLARREFLDRHFQFFLLFRFDANRTETANE